MIFGIPGTRDPGVAYATAITYWVFSCRDSHRSRAKGLETWSQLQTCIQNAAIPSRTMQNYIAQLCDRLTVPALYPSRLNKLLANPGNHQTIWIGDADGNEMRLLTAETIKTGVFISPDEILHDLRHQGITERQILSLLKPVRFGGVPHVINMFCQAAHELHGWKPVTDDAPPDDVVETVAEPVLEIVS